MDDLEYLFAAFTAVWVVIFGYILQLSLKQRRLQREIESIEMKLSEKDDGRT